MPEHREEVDVARAQEYALLAVLLARAPDSGLLDRLTRLRGDGSPLGMAHAALAQAADGARIEGIEREYFDLFVGVGRGQVLPYASYYLTGFLHERPLARLREDLAVLGIELTGERHEPEDHLATLCEIMSGLVGGTFMAAVETQHQFFQKHLAPWAGRFFADLETAQAAKFYRRVAVLGRLFVAIETEAFALPE